ncbi:oxidoreductase [Lophiostoma macrostomum CBS 122681]|uniref:NADP-dependent mannitol dehydrogenase n=1 Tax=Lophiostoma macrostomum CBS 122681 TaxID=1314788 RepID=A0A6A6SM23_9PLEO|nr:oxidoreductase [Lophiostoma macrostomum CBS 122681]
MVLPTHSNPTAPVFSHFDLTGKVALVTGGCRGIGLEAARGLIEAGAKVAITYTSTKPEAAEKIAEELSAANNGTPVKSYKCDVKSKADIEATVEQVARELGNGHLDTVVVNAGIAAHIPAIEYGEDDWKQMMDVNLTGAFWTAQAAAKVFQRQLKEGGDGRASIIFTASVSGILVNVPQEQAPYNASKAALTHLAKSLAVEWVDFARVNCISPGYIATDMIGTLPEEWRKKWPELVPATRFCEAAELKGSYVYLASEASSYITGANLVIDGGYSVL